MILDPDQQNAIEMGAPVSVNLGGTACVLPRRDLCLDPDYDSEPWTVEEMDLLADESEVMISERESHEYLTLSFAPSMFTKWNVAVRVAGTYQQRTLWNLPRSMA